MVRNLAVLALLTSFASVASAQNLDVIKARQTIYKSFGTAVKPLGPMLKGDAPYDAAVVKASLTTIIDGTKKLPSLFPDDSKTGGDTAALPEIWTHKEDFFPRFDKLNADATTAMASITDQASFNATMPKVLGECGACHKEYRAKK